MKKVAIVFYSGTGNTEAMAKAVEEGTNQAGAEARLIHAEAFGCPSMGVEELEEEVFEPMFGGLEI